MSFCLRKVFIVLAFLPIFCVGEVKLTKRELVKKIEYHRKLYWKEGKREISDRQYDLLVAQLRKYDPDHPLLQKSVEGEKGKVKHQQEMRSLQKCYKKSEAIEWCEKVARNEEEIFVIQPKYDGIAVEFSEGRLSTRGDGSWGNDISSKSSLIDFPKKMGKGRVVGELMISDKEFARLEKFSDDYVSSRHAVVAMTSTNDVDFLMRKKIRFHFVCYDSFQRELTLKQLKAHWSKLADEMRDCGYLTDGFVIKLADETYGESLGSTLKYPKNAMAFKWACQRKWTKLIGVNWQLAEKGFVPVGLLKPVELDGANVAKVTLYNYDYIRRNSIKVGDFLQIERVGGTVPVIKGCRKGESRKAISLEKCPECGEKIVFVDKVLDCNNGLCSGKISLQIYKEIKSRKIKGFGLKTITKIVDELRIENWEDLRKKSVNQLCRVNGVSQKKAELLHNGMQKQ